MTRKLVKPIKADIKQHTLWENITHFVYFTSPFPPMIGFFFGTEALILGLLWTTFWIGRLLIVHTPPEGIDGNY